MKRNNRTGPRLFFIEFLIVLFFFLIISTVCLRLFAHAHMITQRADALSHAQTSAASVAAAVESIVNSTDGNINILEAAAPLLSGADLISDGLMIPYDRDFQPCAVQDAYYMLTASVDTSDQKVFLNISVDDYYHESIYELSAAFYSPLTRKEALQ